MISYYEFIHVFFDGNFWYVAGRNLSLSTQPYLMVVALKYLFVCALC
jgi:hypothetical protein